MRQGLHVSSLVLAALFVGPAAAAAQTGRVGGVKDEAGNPIKGATVTARAASPVASRRPPTTRAFSIIS
jgi:hypothetical protein